MGVDNQIEMTITPPSAPNPPSSPLAAPHDSRYRHLVETLDGYAVFLLDPEGRVISWNLGATRMKGYTTEGILGQHFSIFYTNEDKVRGHPQGELDMARATGRYEEEGWRVRKDGSRFWASVTITATHDPDGGLEGYGKVVRDRTRSKIREQNTLALLRRLKQTFRITPRLRPVPPSQWPSPRG